jgi:diadenosine tetraphosphate (Ap4A) HIT family hydrolase
MVCELCDNIEKYRVIKETKFSKVAICKWPLKTGHIIVLPKRHVSQTNMNELNNEELRDFMNLVQKMEDTMNTKFEDPIITFKNSKKHSTEEHLHYHLLPSKGALRDLFSTFENIAKRVDISQEEYEEMRDKLL